MYNSRGAAIAYFGNLLNCFYFEVARLMSSPLTRGLLLLLILSRFNHQLDLTSIAKRSYVMFIVITLNSLMGLVPSIS